MSRKSIQLMLVIALLMPGLASAVTEKDFEAGTTQNLLNLCTASPDDPLYHQAINFCHGYLVGAYHYYVAEGVLELVCVPDPPPSRNDAIDMFIKWAKARPQYWKEKPVETEFRFLMERWPCKR